MEHGGSQPAYDVPARGRDGAAHRRLGPFRRRIQAFIDRRFYRARYDAGQLVEAFSARMRDAVDLAGVVAELEGTARTAVHPRSAWVWLRPR